MEERGGIHPSKLGEVQRSEEGHAVWEGGGTDGDLRARTVPASGGDGRWDG